MIYILFLTSIIFTSTDSSSIKNNYIGGWPKSSNTINEITQEVDCPRSLGCECLLDSDCDNNSCLNHLRGNYCSLSEGDIFPNFQAIDQFGEIISIKDFSNKGKYILLEMGATWCGPCRELADWFSYNSSNIQLKNFWRAEYNQLLNLVHNNDIYFITILYEDEFRDNANNYTVEEWYNNYPDEHIPVIADENKFLHTILKPTGIPAVTLLNENLKIISLSNRGLNKAFDKLIELNILKNNE